MCFLASCLPGRQEAAGMMVEGARCVISTWITVLTLPLPLCWNLGMSLRFSKAQFLLPYNGANNPFKKINTY